MISRDYTSQGFRQRAAERVTLELGPRSEQEIRSGLDKEVGADRWTSLDRSLHDIADEGGGVINLRPGGPGEDPELRRLLLGRAAKLERLALAEPLGLAQWTLKPGIEPALRDLGIRGDIIKSIHRAMSRTTMSLMSLASRFTATRRPSRSWPDWPSAACTTSSRARPTPSSKASTGGHIISSSPIRR